MIIGIDGSRAFLEQRTGIEEYSYQVIKHLTIELDDCQVVLYIKHNQKIDFSLPDTWRAKKLWSPRLWTQIRLSLELLFHPVGVLFIPAHTVPIIHPKHTFVVIHGLEYEFVPAAYSWWDRLYMTLIIKNSCRWAKKIIAVSKNTRQDLVNLYKVPEEKIEVIYEGYNYQMQNENLKMQNDNEKLKINNKYLLFVGRLEERKNIIGIIKAFEILKEKYKIPHKLVLVGKFGYGKEKIREKLKNVNLRVIDLEIKRGPTSLDQNGPKRSDLEVGDIFLTGFVSEAEKWELLKNADVFLFPTLYEGFGLPILEAQSVGVPVVASNVSSIPEVTNGSALLADPTAPEFIAELIYDLISNEEVRSGIIKKGYENVKRFSWEKCAKEIAELLKN